MNDLRQPLPQISSLILPTLWILKENGTNHLNINNLTLNDVSGDDNDNSDLEFHCSRIMDKEKHAKSVRITWKSVYCWFILQPRSTFSYMTSQIYCKAGIAWENMVGELSGYGTIWLYPDGVADILSIYFFSSPN